MKALLISTDCGDNDYRKQTNKYGGVTYYRLVAPQKEINKLGHDFVYLGTDLYKDENANFNKFFKQFDIVITKHIDNPRAAKNVQIACQKSRIPLVYDLDDNLFAIRSDQPAYDKGYRQGEMKRIYMATNMSFADAFFVSTEPLKEEYQSKYKELFNIDMPIHVLPNYNDVTLFSPFESKTGEDVITLGYHGSTTHDSDIKLILPAIDTIMEMYPNVILQLIGTIRRESVSIFESMKHNDRVFIRGGTPAYDTFPELLMGLKWDIGLAPLIDDAFNRGKSHIKYMEYAMKRIPTVASDVYPYAKNATHALLCKDNTEWVSNLSKLIKDKRLRKEIGTLSYKDVVQNHQYSQHAHKWIEACETVIENYKKR